MNTQTLSHSASTPRATKQTSHYSVEFFHIYTDEAIGAAQLRSLEYLKAIQQSWSLNASYVVLIDNYNPTEHHLKAEEVLAFLKDQDAAPDYWAFEADLVENAQQLLASVTNRHLKKNYERYIVQHNKFPCSLLTAAWYLTRLGALDARAIRAHGDSASYWAADYLVNILPSGYRQVENRAHELILQSPYSHFVHKIQDLFYDAHQERALDLF